MVKIVFLVGSIAIPHLEEFVASVAAAICCAVGLAEEKSNFCKEPLPKPVT